MSGLRPAALHTDTGETVLTAAKLVNNNIHFDF